MKVHLKKIILWSELNPSERRELPFLEGKVNVITGNSQTGKSAIIPIIDYCLCSTQCKIPLGKIRNSCSWFGALLGTQQGDILLARRSPSEGKASSEVLFLTGSEAKIPEMIEAGNISISDARKKLNTLFEFPFQMQEDLEDNSVAARPSFRDTVSLCFQPQTIIANPEVLFYKCNVPLYAERLRLIFPFLLNAIGPEWYAQREQMRLLRGEIRDLEREEQAALKVKKNAASGAKVKLLKAQSLGIYHGDIYDNSPAEHYLSEISKIVHGDTKFRPPLFDDKQAQKIIQSITERESDLSLQYANLKRRLKFVVEVGSLYSGNISRTRTRRDYLNLANDIISSYQNESNCPFCGSPHSNFMGEISPLIEAINKFEVDRKNWGTTYNAALDIERADLNVRIKEVEHQITLIDQEKNAFIRDEEERKRLKNWTQDVNALIGELSEFLTTMKRLLPQDNQKRIDALKSKYNNLSRVTASEATEKLKKAAVDKISDISFGYCNRLDIEWSENKARLDIQNLTIRIEQDEGDAFLWEIGSASNWLAYHLGFMLGIHKFAANNSKYIPSFLVFDQPTQAFFPTARKLKEDETYWDESKGDDTERADNIFKLLDDYITETKGSVQLLLFEHAPIDMFSPYENIHIVEEWRDKKLVPIHWYQDMPDDGDPLAQ